jgi:hypothetical protein
VPQVVVAVQRLPAASDGSSDPEDSDPFGGGDLVVATEQRVRLMALSECLS